VEEVELLVNFTERARSQRLNIKFTEAEHDQLVRRAKINGRISLAVEYERQGSLLTLRPSDARGSNVLSKTGGNWAYIVSFDGFQRRSGETFLCGRDLKEELTLHEKCEIRISLSTLVKKASLDLQSALALINKAIGDGVHIEITGGRLAAKS
jgi:hypothetical protein